MIGEAFFGPVLAHMPYEEGVKSGSIVPIEVFIRKITGPDITYKTDVQKERNGYWLNFIRNTGIVSIARGIPDEMQTLIMVKTTEHAMNLHGRLPGYSVVHGGRTRQQWVEFAINGIMRNYYTLDEIAPYADAENGENLMLMDFLAEKINLESYDKFGNPDTTALREQFEAGTLKKAISTTMWKEGIDPVHLRVLIRADGMSGSIPGTQIPGRLARTTEGKKAGILIDFLDCFGDTYYRRSQARIRHYRKQKWRIHDDWDGKFTTSMGSV
jgi:superfamily II DNA or RNA helicase